MLTMFLKPVFNFFHLFFLSSNKTNCSNCSTIDSFNPYNSMIKFFLEYKLVLSGLGNGMLLRRVFFQSCAEKK